MALRQTLLARRQALAQADCKARSQLIQARALVLPSYRAAAAVALYQPLENEVETQAICEDAFAGGKKVFYPRYEQGSYRLVRVGSRAELAPGYFGILEPTGSEYFALPVGAVGVIFVPGVGFDGTGHRLGRGKGWYDRILAELRGQVMAVGLAYEFQVVDTITSQPWDQNMEFVVTDYRTIDCGAEPVSIITDRPVDRQ